MRKSAETIVDLNLLIDKFTLKMASGTIIILCFLRTYFIVAGGKNLFYPNQNCVPVEVSPGGDQGEPREDRSRGGEGFRKVTRPYATGDYNVR
jgi:hypothetical protein